MVWVIAFLVIASYGIGSKSILDDRYRPSLYSRIIWLALAVNSFVSVLALKNSTNIRVMAALGLTGNLIILLLTLKKATRKFGITELASTILLVFSLIIWLVADLPALNLTIGLIAHFIGGIPTYKKVLKDPRDENIYFWFWFFLASILAWITADKSEIHNYLYAAYFTCWDGAIVLLCLRRYLPER